MVKETTGYIHQEQNNPATVILLTTTKRALNRTEKKTNLYFDAAGKPLQQQISEGEK